jgi:hypothetical protein
VSETLARCRAWTLLGDLFRQGLTPAGHAAWAAIPMARAALADHSLAEAAEVHTRVVLLELPLRASAWQSADGSVGGAIADDAAVLLARCGRPAVAEPDTLATSLGLLAFLSGAVLDAERDGVRPPDVADLERDALDQLLAWLPGAVAAIADMGAPAPLYELAAELALDLAVARRSALRPSPAPPVLPPLPALLDDPTTGLRAIAEHLAVPALAGGGFARSTLVALSRDYDLPAGFGGRADLLEGLLRSAAHYGRVVELCGALDALAAGWDRRWATLAGPLGPIAEPWRHRASTTRALLRRLAEAHRVEVDED